MNIKKTDDLKWLPDDTPINPCACPATKLNVIKTTEINSIEEYKKELREWVEKKVRVWGKYNEKESVGYNDAMQDLLNKL